jgi:DNA-binding MarR family transcriptional regulator
MMSQPASSSAPVSLTVAQQQALRLDKQLCFALYSTSLAMTKAYKPLLEQLDLTYPQYLVMLILWEKDGLALKEVGEQLQIDSGALTPVIKRLETQGLLTRRRLPENERTLQICLTAAGQALQLPASQLQQQLGSQCGLFSSETAQLRDELVQLRRRLQLLG